jgi:IS30 family transposase
MKYFKHLSINDRLLIESMIIRKKKPPEIASRVGCSLSTIYREFKRGVYSKMNSELITKETYSPDIAHERYKRNLKAKGCDIKIGNDHKLAKHIENKIVNEKYSPAAVLGEILTQGLKFDTTITTRTLYSYIDKGIFLKLTNKDLMFRGKRKRKYRKVRAKRAALGDSIEKRPGEINSRESFGHWEMDLLKGNKKTKSAVLVMTERLTRTQLMMKMKDKTSDSVLRKLKNLERTHGKEFPKLFKTITVDNGSEFGKVHELEKLVKIYYCHPYSSWERGSNEKQNQMIRKHFPKGTNFDRISNSQIHEVETWLNNYPRKIFGYKTAYDMLQQHLEKI